MMNPMHSFGLSKLSKLGLRLSTIINAKFMSTKSKYDIKGRVVLITGAATGIGADVARALLVEGVKGVTLTDVNLELGKKVYCELAECYGAERVQFIKCDVLCHNEIEDAFEHTVKCFDQLDIVFNNAGILQETDVCRTVNINLTAVIVGTQLAIEKYLPKYRSYKEGVVLNTASILGHTTVPFAPTYCATKHALIGLGSKWPHNGKSWSENSGKGLLYTISKGQRLIILHAGGEMVFVPNCLVIFKFGLKTGDYHDEMNSSNYEKWLQEKLIPNLPDKSVVVIDNAPYHNIQMDKTSNDKKCNSGLVNQSKHNFFAKNVEASII